MAPAGALPPHRQLVSFLEAALDCLVEAGERDGFLPHWAQRQVHQLADDLVLALAVACWWGARLAADRVLAVDLSANLALTTPRHWNDPMTSARPRANRLRIFADTYAETYVGAITVWPSTRIMISPLASRNPRLSPVETIRSVLLRRRTRGSPALIASTMAHVSSVDRPSRTRISRRSEG